MGYKGGVGWTQKYDRHMEYLTGLIDGGLLMYKASLWKLGDKVFYLMCRYQCMVKEDDKIENYAPIKRQDKSLKLTVVKWR